MISKTLLAVLSTTAALSLGASARAGVLPAGYEQNSVTVAVSDLNLDNEAGAHKMLARIAYAANRVCGEAGNAVDLRHRVLHRTCVRTTVEHSLAKLDSPRVSEVYTRPPQMTLASYRGN